MSDRSDDRFAELRGDQLQRERDLIEDDRRQRHHQDQERDREEHAPADRAQPKRNSTVPPIAPISETRVRNSSMPSTPSARTKHAAEHDHQAEQARRGRRGEELVAALPRQVRGDGRNQIAVGVVVVRAPGAKQLGDDVSIENGQPGDDERAGQQNVLRKTLGSNAHGETCSPADRSRNEASLQEQYGYRLPHRDGDEPNLLILRSLRGGLHVRTHRAPRSFRSFWNKVWSVPVNGPVLSARTLARSPPRHGCCRLDRRLQGSNVTRNRAISS